MIAQEEGAETNYGSLTIKTASETMIDGESDLTNLGIQFAIQASEAYVNAANPRLAMWSKKIDDEGEGDIDFVFFDNQNP